jgi:hypothetical protein
MKTIVLATGVVALCVGSAQADVLFMAPGISANVLKNVGTTPEIYIKPAGQDEVEFTSYEITAVHCVIKANNPLDPVTVHNNGSFVSPDSVLNKITVGVYDPEGKLVVDWSHTLDASSEKDFEEVILYTGSLALFDKENGESGYYFKVSQEHGDGGTKLLSDDSYIVVEGNYSLDAGANSASVEQTDSVVMKHDSTCNMTWKIGDSPQGGPNNGFGNNADAIDPSNKNYIDMIGKWYPASSTTQASLNGVIIVDDDEM